MKQDPLHLTLRSQSHSQRLVHRMRGREARLDWKPPHESAEQDR